MEISNNIRRALIKVVIALIFIYGLYLIWAVIAFGGGCKRMAPEKHILPYGYIGKVFILFNQDEGCEVEYENNTRVYRISESGILRTQFKKNIGWIDASENLEFYYQKDDSLIPINNSFLGKNGSGKLDSNSIVVFEYGIGSVWEGLGQGDINSATYIVDSLKNSDKRDYSISKDKFSKWDKSNCLFE